MYLIGKGHQHTGPGTSMTQFNVPAYNYRGMGACGSCETRASLGACCADCAKGSGSCSGGLMGMGLFESGADFTQWGYGEWAVVGLGAYLILSLAGDTRRTVTGVRKFQRRRRRAVAA